MRSGIKTLKWQKAENTVESVVFWKTSVLQLDHSDGCYSTIDIATFFQCFKTFITAGKICCLLSQLDQFFFLWDYPVQNSVSWFWFIGHIRQDICSGPVFRTVCIFPGYMCSTLMCFQQTWWWNFWLNIWALCDPWITWSASKDFHRNNLRFSTIISF